MREYLFRVWPRNEHNFSYYVYAEDEKMAKWKVMRCLGDKNELNMQRLYCAEVVRELINGNGITTTQVPITRSEKYNAGEK